MDVSYYIQVLLTLGTLGLILFLVTKYAKKIKLTKYSGDIKLIDRLSIDTNVVICLIETKQKQYLMGVTGKNITIIEKY